MEYKYSTKSQAENGVDNTTIMTPLRVKQSIQVNGGASPSTQVQSDWNQTNTSSPDYIKNKPQNLAYTDQNNNFSAGQTVHNYLTVLGDKWQYGTEHIASGYDLEFVPLGPSETNNPPLNDTGDIVFKQWKDDDGTGQYYREIEKARIWVENSLNNTNYSPSYRAYRNDGTTIVAERKLRTSGVFQARTTSGYEMTWTSAWSDQKVNFNTELMNTIGITLNNGDMTVPSGVNKVRLHARVCCNNNQLSGDKGLKVYVNGNFAVGIDYTNSNDLYHTLQGETYLTVNEGDVISVYMTSGTTGTMEVFYESGVMIELV